MFPFNLEAMRKCKVTENYCSDDRNNSYYNCPIYQQALLEEVRRKHSKREEYKSIKNGW